MGDVWGAEVWGWMLPEGSVVVQMRAGIVQINSEMHFCWMWLCESMLRDELGWGRRGCVCWDTRGPKRNVCIEDVVSFAIRCDGDL